MCAHAFVLVSVSMGTEVCEISTDSDVNIGCDCEDRFLKTLTNRNINVKIIMIMIYLKSFESKDWFI